ncbi:hypothetical protein V2M31_10550, partial [Streptococcus pneumoniae]
YPDVVAYLLEIGLVKSYLDKVFVQLKFLAILGSLFYNYSMVIYLYPYMKIILERKFQNIF